MKRVSWISARSWLARLSFVSLPLAAIVAVPTESFAAPTVWARAKYPDAARRTALLEEVDLVLLRHDVINEGSLGSGLGKYVWQTGIADLLEARVLLEKAGGGDSPDARVKLRYANVLRRLEDADPVPGSPRIAQAAAVLRSVVRAEVPEPVAAAAWNALAICYAKLGQREEEVAAYGEALAREAVAHQRAMLLSNRAESFMAMGRLDEAIRGYRESLRSLLPIEMFDSGVTTLWGLAVALDRDGDLDAALENIKLARAYDAEDRKLHSSSWFFSPPHDEAWYAALGAWQAARSTGSGAARAEFYEQAIGFYQDYLLRAPADDRWRPLAKARLGACQAERDRVLEAARRR